MDAALLARVQFALTIMFHYLFPPLTIGLGGIMVYLEAKFLKTRDPQYEALAKFWTKIFALTFALGVASGIVMEFQFGTNWATYSRFVGDVFGSALAAEGIFAFFLESGFLAVLVFGWDKVSPRIHFFATCMVALGAMFSAVWIVVANSWMQTPAGFHIVGTGALARAEITDFWAVVFNPSSMHRLGHVLIGCYILAAFFVMSISAYYILKNRHRQAAEKSFKVALTIGLVASLLQLVSGDGHAKNVAQYQPAKLAAMEGLYQTPTGGAPLHIFGFPDTENQQVKGGIAIPGMLSFLVHGNFTGTVAGLDQFPREDWPPVGITFQSFHLMVGMGMMFIGLTVLATWYRWRKTLFQQRWLLWVFVFAVPLPFAANQLGWIAAEVGRQPWIVYGLLRTNHAISKSVSADQIIGSIIMFTLIYALLFSLWIYLLDHKIKQGPEDIAIAPATGGEASLSDIAGIRSGTGGPSLSEPHPDEQKPKVDNGGKED